MGLIFEVGRFLLVATLVVQSYNLFTKEGAEFATKFDAVAAHPHFKVLGQLKPNVKYIQQAVAVLQASCVFSIVARRASGLIILSIIGVLARMFILENPLVAKNRADNIEQLLQSASILGGLLILLARCFGGNRNSSKAHAKSD
jgi:hypothetical protein